MQNEQVEAIINSLGAIAEMLATLRDGLIEHGFTEQQTMALCLEYLRCLSIKDYGRPKDAE